MFATLPIPIPLPPTSTFPAFAGAHIESIPSEEELITAIATERGVNPELGIMKVVENVRFVRGWSVGEKRVRKILKSRPDLSAKSPSATHDDLPSPPASPTHTHLIPTRVLPPLRPTPTGTRGRLRTPKPIPSTSRSCAETSICNHKAHMDAWLPGPLLPVRVHLDYLPSLTPPEGMTSIWEGVRLHVMQDEKTGREFVLAPEVCRSVWGRLDARVAHLAHSLYSPPPSSFTSHPSVAHSEIRLLGCPQGLKTTHCTTLGRRGDVEKVWVFLHGDEGEREIRVEFGAECHSENPAKPKARKAVGGEVTREEKGKGVVKEREVFVKVKAENVRRG